MQVKMLVYLSTHKNQQIYISIATKTLGQLTTARLTKNQELKRNNVMKSNHTHLRKSHTGTCIVILDLPLDQIQISL